jgi:hypothetical protein
MSECSDKDFDVRVINYLYITMVGENGRALFQPFKAQWEQYVRTALAISNCTFCIYRSRMVLGVNIGYFLKQR